VTAIISDHTEQIIFDWWERRMRFDVRQASIFDEGLITVDSDWDVTDACR
jgi:hypothetical protein